MKRFIKHIVIIALASLTFASCTKYNELIPTNNNNNNNNNNVTPVVKDTPPTIKFYDAMDFGSMDINLNGKKVTSVALYYSSAYINAKEGTNTLAVNYTNKTKVLLNTTFDLVKNTNYSCFLYMVGNEWKYNLVKDDNRILPNQGNSAMRILDFRPEAYYNYVNLTVQSSSSSGFFLQQSGRNFLDHVTYSTHTIYRQLPAGSYDMYFRNPSNENKVTAYRNNIQLENKAIYTIMLTNTVLDTPYTRALNYIYPYVVRDK